MQTGQLSEGTNIEDLLVEAERVMREVDPSVVPVAPRILRRVIMQDHELPGLGFQIPHRKSYIITQERLFWIVARDELGSESVSALPSSVILIAQPAEHRLADMTLPELLSHYWRLLFHARVHVTLEQELASRQLTPARIRERIDRIGQAEFDEIYTVLRQEKFLLRPNDYEAAYVEFAAVYLELRYFAPNWLSTYFPGINDWQSIDAILAEDLDADSLFQNTRPASVADPAPEADVAADESSVHWARQEATAAATEPHAKTFRKLISRAEKVSAWGNNVRAAILRLRAAHYAVPDEVSQTATGALAELDRLVERLQAALGFHQAEAKSWRNALKGVLANSAHGFWNADRRLLYDLQKVCVDHEREISVVDLLRWLRTLGRSPIRRPLPNQREVLIAKHLRSAARRLSAARLTGSERERLSHLLHNAARSAEENLRLHLRPLMAQALEDVGLQPANLPERVALRKLIEELLDCIVSRGYLTMGHLRDAISRNNLKLDDLSGVQEFWQGDRLLRADRRLGQLLDGVYHRGEIYLRALQGLSSLSFGTRLGRFITKYLALPFGGAYIILAGLQHLLEMVFGDTGAPHILTPLTLLGLGGGLLGLLHVESFRSLMGQIIRAIYNVIHGFVVEIPNWIVSRTVIREFLRSLPVVIFRRFALIPLTLTGLSTLAWSQWKYPQPLSFWETTGVFLTWAVALNSRIGRTFQESISESVAHTWYHIRVRVFVALFELVMETFKRLLEAFERILYAVDEWLRFKSGETRLTLAMKAVLGVAWSAVTFVTSFCVTLLIEPQINPIKHFPVVTVSHKIILPSLPFLANLLTNPLGPVWGNTVATAVVFLLPGVFGFLVWELKGNWQLYAANRSHRLTPVPIGEHGESMIRFLRPGFYSGTVPKLYTKLRRSVRHAGRSPQRHQSETKYRGKLHHVEDALRRFVEREFLGLLEESRYWDSPALSVGTIQITSGSIGIDLEHAEAPECHLAIVIQEQSGYLVGNVVDSGLLARLTAEQRRTLEFALSGLYKLTGVELVREQIEACLPAEASAYGFSERGLMVWPGGQFEIAVRYDLQQRPTIQPRPRSVARLWELEGIDAQNFIFAHSPILWQHWVNIWEAEHEPEEVLRLFPKDIPLLPEPQPETSSVD